MEKWDDIMLTLGQIWVLWEVFNTTAMDSEFEILISDDERKVFLDGMETGQGGFEGFQKVPAEIDASNAGAENEDDRNFILGHMRDVGLGNLNRKVAELLRLWMYKTVLDFIAQH